jgi:biopolymer transport protein ExbD
MVQKRRFLDVWIIESNTVYREVPYEVVADWVQQGRLLEDDRLRPSGTAEWFRVGASPEFSPYLPKPEPMRANDQAEALEPVELEFRYKKPRDPEDDDVDMIPLIDVSLVLLIFFMLTATPGTAAMFIATPEATHGTLAEETHEVIVGILLKGKGEAATPYYRIWVGTNPPKKEHMELETEDDLLKALRELLSADTRNARIPVSINAHPDTKAGVVRHLTASLDSDPEFRKRIERKHIGVSEKKP